MGCAPGAGGRPAGRIWVRGPDPATRYEIHRHRQQRLWRGRCRARAMALPQGRAHREKVSPQWKSLFSSHPQQVVRKARPGVTSPSYFLRGKSLFALSFAGSMNARLGMDPVCTVKDTQRLRAQLGSISTPTKAASVALLGGRWLRHRHAARGRRRLSRSL
jgi:hypothetical protein